MGFVMRTCVRRSPSPEISGDRNKLTKNVGAGNNGEGIALAAGSDKNAITGNTMVTHGPDMREPAGCATNSWTKNIFGFANDACVQ